ncbi:PEGA domain-containing protein [Candidatus Uhrbacteria bacterium]|nr:PEGA domain-containing protein [Candidatus Uhrbacteria bacterium]
MARKIPFHRRVLPWLFTIIFLVFAPILVFYTAGYRWNPKKGMVEKNGTLILDSTPRGADIYLNGQTIDDKTPATLQNVAPGTYDIRLSKSGYHDWKKTLNIIQERVTFANEIILWPDENPTLALEEEAYDLFTNPDFDYVFGFRRANGDSYVFRIEKDALVEEKRVARQIDAERITWDRGGEKAIITGYTSNTAGQWLLSAEPLNLTELPEASYHFERSELVGMDETYRVNLNANGALSKQLHNEQIIDSYDDLVIKQLDAQDNLVLLMEPNAEQGLILPSGAWRFYTSENGEIILDDGDAWLRIDTRTNPFTTTRARADEIHALEIDRESYYLLELSNELYLWPPLLEPELLHRQSSPIINAGWHQDGLSIFYATDKQVTMMNLDNRDGRLQTKLAEFDQIKDVIAFEDTLYISAVKENKAGIWTLPLVKSSNLSPLSAVDGIISF